MRTNSERIRGDKTLILIFFLFVPMSRVDRTTSRPIEEKKDPIEDPSTTFEIVKKVRE